MQSIPPNKTARHKSLGRKTFTKFMFRVFCKIENIIIIIVKLINIAHQFL